MSSITATHSGNGCLAHLVQNNEFVAGISENYSN